MDRSYLTVVVWQLLAILGEQFIVGNEICGAVISIRPAEDIVSIWNRTASDDNVTGKIRLSCLTLSLITTITEIR